MRRYAFMAVYSYSSGFGNCDAYTNERIPRVSTLREWERDIASKHHLEGVVILNVISVQYEADRDPYTEKWQKERER